MTKVIRIVIALCAVVFLQLIFETIGQHSAVLAEDTKKAEQEVYVPKDLDDCFVELRKILKPEDIQKMKEGAESEMIRYHRGLGTWLRNNWGLWRGSRLAKWFNQKGIHHPDDMSGIILVSFWRHLNSKPVALEDQIKRYQRYWQETKIEEKREEKRTKFVERKIRNMMMGLSVVSSKPPLIRVSDRKSVGLRARYLAKWHGGILITIRAEPVKDFSTRAYFLDLERKKLHPIRIPEIENMHSSVVIGGVAYFAGADGKTPILVAIDRGNRSLLPLPEEDSSPQLGIDGTKLLAVYRNSVYLLEGRQWSEIYRGGVQLPKSGPPPQKFENRIFFRDEGLGENQKRLWWLELTQRPQLVSLDQDIGVVGPNGPRWENSFSYCLAPDGALWATVGEGYAQQSLIKRAASGKYEIAIMNNSVHFEGAFLGRKDKNDGLPVSAVSIGNDGSLLAAGNQGLYSIQGRLIRQLLAFANTSQEVPINGGKNVYHWGWDPSNILEEGKGNYVISGAFGGIYLIEHEDSGLYTIISLDETLGEPITF